MSQLHVDIVLQSNPLSRSLVHAICEPGITLESALGPSARHEVLRVELQGEYIPREEWQGRTLHAGDQILVRVLPKGGDFDAALRAALTVALAIFATWVVGPLGIQLAWVKAATIFGITLAGSMAINAMLPPPSADLGTGDSAKTLSDLSPAQNEFDPWGPVAKLYGKMRVFPKYAAAPWTEVLGGVQYFHGTFAVGIGEYDISEAKIGDMLLTEFDGVDLTQTTEPTQTKVFEESVGVSLDDPENPDAELTDDVRTSGEDADSISIDILLPLGLIYTNDDADRLKARIDFTVEFRLAGSSDPWVNVRDTDYAAESNGSNVVIDVPGEPPVSNNIGFLQPHPDNDDEFRLEALTINPQRVGLKWPVGDRGQYDVRVSRVRLSHGAPDEDDYDGTDNILKYSQDFVWSVIRTWTDELAIVPSNVTVTYLELRIKATDQLNQAIEEFSVIAEAKIPVWNGSSWNLTKTRNPTWAWVDILTGEGNARPISKDSIDKARILEWAGRNSSAGRKYDRYFASQVGVYEAQREAAAVGRAGLVMSNGGLYSVIEDFVDTTPVQVFTPRNYMTFKSVKGFPEVPHALRIPFIDQDQDWKEDEAIVYNDGYDAENATKFATLPFPGVTDYDQVWKLARYHLAALTLRPETYQWEADIEAVICQRGDVVRVQSDVTLWGTGAGRIKAIDGDTITSDEKFTFESGKEYFIRIRKDDGTLVVDQINNFEVGFNKDTFDFTGSMTGVKVGDLFALGEEETQADSQRLVIQSIQWSEDRVATITAVDLSPEIDEADTGDIPPFDPNITLPLDPSKMKPPVPIIVDVRSDDSSLQRNATGILVPRVVVSFWFSQDSLVGYPAVSVEGRQRPHDDGDIQLAEWSYLPSVSADEGAFAFWNVEPGIEYDFALRAVSSGGVPSQWANAPPFTVVIAQNGPPALIGLDAEGEPARVRVDFDLSGYTGNENIQYFIVVCNTVNDRNDPDTLFFKITPPFPLDSQPGETFSGYVFFNDTTERFFWAAPLDPYGNLGEYFPADPEDGVAATPQAAGAGPAGDDALFYQIKPLNGTAIKNGVGTLTIEAHKIEGAVDTHLSSGAIKLYDEDNEVLGDGYTATLGAADILGDMVVSLKDAPDGATYDTITLLDIADGADNPDVVYGSVRADNGIAFIQAANGGAWSPTGGETELTGKFYRAGILIAQKTVRVTLNEETGALTAEVV